MTHDELLLFGERLRSRRNVLGFTQEYVSDKIGISLRFYQMIERGEKSVSGYPDSIKQIVDRQYGLSAVGRFVLFTEQSNY